MGLLAILLQLPDGILLQQQEDVAEVVKELLLQGLHLVHLAAVEVLVILVQHIQELVADIKELLIVCEVSLLVAGRCLLGVAYSPSLETN